MGDSAARRARVDAACESTGATEETVAAQPDIFDRLMGLPGLRVCQPFYARHKEPLMYLLFGGLSFVLNIVLFAVLAGPLGLHALVANVISWVLVVLFQFFTNRTWVFDSHTRTTDAFLAQLVSFFGSRVFTLVVEELILVVFISWLAFNTMAVKLGAQVVVIVLNYVLSKWVVFRK